jgi:hypothetical protein
MTKKLALPSILFAINIGSAIVYAMAGDWKKAVYWIASAVCIAVVAAD